MLPPVQRRLIALAAGTAVGFGAAAPAFGGQPIAASGDATSVSATAADLNGVVARAAPGTRWRFAYSPNARMRRGLTLTPAVPLHGRVVAVERHVSYLRPHTRYFWRIVVLVTAGHRTYVVDGARRSFVTGPPTRPVTPPTRTTTTTGTTTAPAPGAATAPPAASTTTGAPTATTGTATTPTATPAALAR